MSLVERQLKAELASLQSAFEALRLRSEGLELRVQALEAEIEERGERGEASERRASSPARVSESFRGGSSWSPVSSSCLRSQLIDPEDTLAREVLCQDIASFITRALRGQHRGSSGRDRLKIQSRIYLVFADFHGTRFPEPKAFTNFGDCKALCKRGNNCGSAVFIGLPTTWEAKLVCEAAGFPCPASLTYG